MNAFATAPAVVPQLQVRELRADENQQWDQFVFACPSATFFHLYRWTKVVEEVLRYRCFRLAAWRGSQITGVFPVVLVRSRLFGDCLVSTPLAVYGGIAANDRETFDALLKSATELGVKHHVKYVEMRNCTEEFPIDLPSRDLYVNFTQDLTSGPDKLMQTLPRDTRYMVRKSLKNGLEWVHDISTETFYNIYAHSVHRLGTPVFPKHLFTKIREQFPEHCRIFGVRKENVTIAGVLCFYFRDQVLPYYGGSLAEFNRDAPNNFMYWSLIAQSCAEGLKHFDFGRSKKGTGSYTFKSAWSMKETRLPYRYQLVKAREIPHLSPVDKKFQLPIEVWKRLPFEATKVLGPAVIRWIPSL
jgi:FemAB-related protein (PEP-CTERM system-associated)